MLSYTAHCKRFSQVGERIGCLMLQLPGGFWPDKLARLESLFKQLPQDFDYAVEVRHLGFFDKGEQEKRFNQLLARYDVNRVIMDTRGLFAEPPQTALVEEVQSKKPRVPTNVVATGGNPIVRFVGHPDLARNREFYRPWLNKLAQWCDAGLTPYFFFHMPDNAMAPWLAEQFFEDVNQAHPHIATPRLTLPPFDSGQGDMFG